MKVYSFEFCPCIYESGYRAMSIHKTKKGAYIEMKKFLLKEYMEWYDLRTRYGKNSDDKFGRFEDWHIKEIDIQD